MRARQLAKTRGSKLYVLELMPKADADMYVIEFIYFKNQLEDRIQ